MPNGGSDNCGNCATGVLPTPGLVLMPWRKLGYPTGHGVNGKRRSSIGLRGPEEIVVVQRGDHVAPLGSCCRSPFGGAGSIKRRGNDRDELLDREEFSSRVGQEWSYPIRWTGKGFRRWVRNGRSLQGAGAGQ